MKYDGIKFLSWRLFGEHFDFVLWSVFKKVIETLWGQYLLQWAHGLLGSSLCVCLCVQHGH